MNNLTRYQHNNLELLIDTETGECFAGRNAIARMAQVHPTTITRFTGSAQIYPIDAEIPTNGGFQGGTIYDEDAIYKCLAEYNPNLLAECAKLGLRVYLHTLAGYEVISTAVKPREFSRLELIDMARESELAYLAEKEKVERLQLKAAENKPYVTLGKASTMSDGELDLGEFAKLIEEDVGKNKLIGILKDMGYLLKKEGSEPYQKYVEQGLFKIRRNHSGYTYTVITNKGQVRLIRKIKNQIRIQRKACQLITDSVQLSLGID